MASSLVLIVKTIPVTTVVNMSFSFWMVSSNCCFIDSKEDFSEESNVTSVVEQLSMLLFLILEEIASILSSLLVWSAIDSNFSTRSVKSEHDKDVLCLLVETDSILWVTESIESVINCNFAIFSFISADEQSEFAHSVVNKWVVCTLVLINVLGWKVVNDVDCVDDVVIDVEPKITWIQDACFLFIIYYNRCNFAVKGMMWQKSLIQ